MKLYGYVKDSRGKPVEIAVTVDGLTTGRQSLVMTNASGYYECQLKGDLQYIVALNPSLRKQIGIYTLPIKYLSQKQLVRSLAPETRVDFIAVEGGTLWLQAYSETGKEMFIQDFVDFSRIGAYPPGVFPYGDSIQAKYHGFPLYWGWIDNSNKNIACLLLPPKEPASIWMLWRLPEVGTTYLHADNDGKGFSVDTAAVLPVNLVYEFARTEYREVSQRYQELLGKMTFSEQIANWLDEAKESMTQAESRQQQGLQKDSAIYSYKVLTNVIKAREQMVLEKAQQDIEEFRKGVMTITLTDEKGNKIPNAKVEYQQVSHDFAFSIGWPSTNQYSSLRDAGFNHACFEGWWDLVTTGDGTYTMPDTEIERLTKAGFKIFMHAGIWLNSFSPRVPKRAETMGPAELAILAYQYSNDVLTYYGDKVSIYNVFNEPDLIQAHELNIDELTRIVTGSANGARDAGTNALTYLNIGFPILGNEKLDKIGYRISCDWYGKIFPDKTSYDSPASSGYDFVRMLTQENVDFGAIGLEFYNGLNLPPLDLGLFSDTLDFYGTLGKPMVIFELSYATLDDYPNLEKWWEKFGGWHEGYTDKAQADWARYAITVAFSKPLMSGVQWVAAADGEEIVDYVGYGLFHKDRTTPRQSLIAIGDTLKSWTTKGSGQTNKDGSFSFRGFGGDYDLKITADDGSSYQTRIHVSEQKDNTTNIKVDTARRTITSTSQ